MKHVNFVAKIRSKRECLGIIKVGQEKKKTHFDFFLMHAIGEKSVKKNL